MHYLKKEFDRLKHYAKGLGIKVTIKPIQDPTVMAEWFDDGSEIVIYSKDNKQILRKCLCLYHELSHHMYWVHNGRKGDIKTHDALIKEEEHENMGKPLPKKYRKIIYEMEIKESVYQELIHKEIGSKIPLWRLQVERELDIFVYKYWYEHGKLPTLKLKKEQFRKLKVQYGRK